MRRDSDQIVTEWLVLTAQSGQTAALDQLLKLWYPKFLRYSTQQLRDGHAAKDAVQETLLTVAKTIRGLKDPAAFPKWAYQILHRRGVDIQRQNIRQRGREVSYGHPQELESVELEPVIDRNDDEGLNDALHKLGEFSYNVIHLHYLHGLSVKEISEICDIREGTVKSRLHTARKELRELLVDKL